MPRAHGHDPGQAPDDGATPLSATELSWGDYVDWLVETHGTLAAAAERLAELRAYKDDVASIERALRRLRTRGTLAGGAWGARALSAFGLPGAADARARWMGAYHSRFTDLPVPLCKDLLRMWDRPPVSEAPSARVWLALAHATCALRSAELEQASLHLERARASSASAPPEARAELLLVEAFVASREDPARASSLLDRVAPLLSEPMSADDRACLGARLVDQRAYEINRGRSKPPDHEASAALYLAMPGAGVPPFALTRRASGLAYSRWKQGRKREAVAHAEEAIRHAGDGGHLRLRAMALTMLGRILGEGDGDGARERAAAIVKGLEDEALRMRFERR